MPHYVVGLVSISLYCPMPQASHSYDVCSYGVLTNTQAIRRYRYSIVVSVVRTVSHTKNCTALPPITAIVTVYPAVQFHENTSVEISPKALLKVT